MVDTEAQKGVRVIRKNKILVKSIPIIYFIYWFVII